MYTLNTNLRMSTKRKKNYNNINLIWFVVCPYWNLVMIIIIPYNLLVYI